MYPLLLMLILHTCAALPPLFEGPFIRSPSLFPSVADGWPSLNILHDFDSDWFMPFPATGPRPVVTKPPSTGSGTTESAECRAVSDVSGLSFPPHSEIPTDGLKPEEILKNEVKQTTYLCKDKDDNEFYMLRTHAVFATHNIHNEQSTANYYSKKDNKPLVIGKDLNLDQTKLWEIVDSQEQQKEQEDEKPSSFASAFSSPFGLHSYWPSPKRWWHPYAAYEAVKQECEKHDELKSVEYPKIEVEDSVLGDKVVKKDVKHETFLCTESTNKTKYFLLKTTIDVSTKSGSTFSRVQSISHPADSDGNPLTDTDGSSHPKILSDTLSAVSQSFSTSSSKSKYNK
ncbi:uncharacterized protein LOC142325999 [Lycorma delicatula]|uniref:uncharacterized protein LOC142325999 n=1 Tax=Lycorma delicatula TaxID=130591 RepID=UPI003F5143EC